MFFETGLTNCEKVARLKEAWNALRLEILQPAELSPVQFEAMVDAHSSTASMSFRRQIPMVVACVKPNVQRQLLELGRDVSSPWWPSDTSSMQRAFAADTAKITELVQPYPAVLYASDITVAVFDQPMARGIHTDGRQLENMTFNARVGALPMWYVPNHYSLERPPHIQALLQAAASDVTGPAHEALQDMEALVPLPLGDVLLMLGETLHCSSGVPTPTLSAYMQSWFGIQKTEPSPN